MTAEGTAAYLQHAIPGRIRVKVPSRRGDQAYFKAAAEKLSESAGITRVEINPRTSSVLIEYEPGDNDFARLVVIGRELGIEDLISGAPPLLDELRNRTHDARREASSLLSDAGLDFGTSVFLILAGLSVVQLMRGQILAPAVTLLWYAGATLLMRKGAPQS